MYLGAPLDVPEQTLGQVALMQGESALAWSELSALQASEVLADLEDLTS